MISKNMKKKRELAGVSVAKMAEKMGVSAPNIYRIESSKNVSQDVMERYAKILNMSVSRLIEELPEAGAERSSLAEGYQSKCQLWKTIESDTQNKRSHPMRRIGIDDACKLLGLPVAGFVDIERGEFRGRIEDLLVYLAFFGIVLEAKYLEFVELDRAVKVDLQGKGGKTLEEIGLSIKGLVM